MSPILEPTYELETRPGVIDGADLYIDESIRQSEIADQILIQIGQ